MARWKALKRLSYLTWFVPASILIWFLVDDWTECGCLRTKLISSNLDHPWWMVIGETFYWALADFGCMVAWVMGRLWGPVLQSITGIAIAIGVYIYFYRQHLLRTDTNIIRIMPFRIWGDSENRYNSEGLATRLRDEIQKLQRATPAPPTTHKGELQFATDKVETLPSQEVDIQYQGISPDRVNSYLRLRLFGRETLITGDVQVAGDKLFVAVRGTGIGPWEATIDSGSYPDLQKQLERLAVLIAGEMYPDSTGGIANMLTKRQIKLDSSQDYQESLRYALLHLELQPESATAHYNLAISYKDSGQLDAAILHVKKAVEINPDDAAAHYNLGTGLASKGDTKNAILHYRKAIELKPGEANAYNNLGAALMEEGETENAILHYKKAIELKPGEANAYNNLGIALGEKGDFENAIPPFKKAIELDPEYADPHNNLGTTLTHIGDTKNAILHYRKALELDPDYARAHRNLGLTLAESGKEEEARKEFAKAHRLDPTLKPPPPAKKRTRKAKKKEREKRKLRKD